MFCSTGDGKDICCCNKIGKGSGGNEIMLNNVGSE